MNNFKSQLRNASIKLQRAIDTEGQFDPQSGFTADEIALFIRDLPSPDNGEEISLVKATLRRYGYEA